MKKFRVLFSKRIYYTVDVISEIGFRAAHAVETGEVDLCDAKQVDAPKFMNAPEVIGVEIVPFKDGE